MNQWIKHQQPDADAEDRSESALNSSGVSALIESGKESLGSSQCTHNDFHTYLLSSVGPRQPLFSYKQHENNQVLLLLSLFHKFSIQWVRHQLLHLQCHSSSDKMQKDEKTKRGLHIKTRILDLLDVRFCHWLVLLPLSPVYTGNMLSTSCYFPFFNDLLFELQRVALTGFKHMHVQGVICHCQERAGTQLQIPLPIC